MTVSKIQSTQPSNTIPRPDLEHLGNLLRSGKPPSYLTEESDGGEEEEDESADLPYSVHSPQVQYLSQTYRTSTHRKYMANKLSSHSSVGRHHRKQLRRRPRLRQRQLLCREGQVCRGRVGGVVRI